MLASALLLAVATLAVIFSLYPSPFPQLQGLWTVLGVMAIVDVVLGPVLTFVVFNPAKKSLKADLTVIVLIQFIALIYALHIAWDGRPVYAVYFGDRFEIATANEFDASILTKANKMYSRLPFSGPKWVGAQIPERDVNGKNEMLFSAIFGGGVRITPKYYVTYSQVKDNVIRHLVKVNSLLIRDKNRTQPVLNVVKSMGRKNEDVGLIPLKGKAKYGTVFVDARTGEILQVTDLDPWWY